jgi:hypothetical protein
MLGRRFVGGIVAVTMFAAVVGTRVAPSGAATCDPTASNAVTCENQLPGNPKSEWDISGSGDSTIQGFATQISVNRGETVTFKIKSTAAAYHLDIYRLGWYGGLGARKVATVTPSASLPQSQPACLGDTTTGLIDCGNWAASASWPVPSTAVSGVYIAKAIREDTGGASHIVFVVRDDASHSDLLFQTSDTTWQAYNTYGGNSLYQGSPAGRAYKVSYNRPFSTRGVNPEDWLFNAEYPMIRWLEANGYDVSYLAGADTDRRGAVLQQHRAFMSVGHDEYWSGAQRTNVEAARDAGVDLAFFSGNELFWKTRWEPSIDASASAYRTLVCYKETHANAVIDPADPPTWTGTWRDPRFSPPADGGRPENALTGTNYAVNGIRNDAIKVPAEDGKLRFWRNTSVASLAAGQTATLPAGTLGYEWDEDADNGARPAGLIGMSSTTVSLTSQRLLDYGSTYGAGSATHRLTLYRAASGALVFGAGTVQWPWGLDATHDRTAPAPDPSMRQATVNLFADMGVQPQTLQSGLTTATASTDTTAPTARVTSPANGDTVTAGTPVVVSGAATDVGGVVGGVEVSVDGGTTWHPATGRASWTYTWTPQTAGTTTVLARATDDSANRGAASAAATVTIASGSTATCPCSLWPPSATPANASSTDTAAVEIGVKFTSDRSGAITALRYYKSSQNTGTHVGHLWTSGGALLGTVTFNSESASGWQQATFGTPVNVSAGTTYVASYHTDVGHYAADQNYFATASRDAPPLHAPAATTTPNGVYRYGTTSGFPASSYKASNYWVDVVFEDGTVDTTPPRVVSTAPADGATGVATTVAPTATFSEAVTPASIAFTVTDPAGAAVAGTTTWSGTALTATFQPSSPLQPQTKYTAQVSGATDAAGNQMTSATVWSFTTAAATQPPPADDGPGGPILVISTSADPFSRYYAEILRAEGLNSFLVKDLSTVTSATLTGYDVAVLGAMPLTSTQVTMLSNWVSGGGNLVAMRPDKKLAPLLGLTAGSSSVSEGYLRVDTSTAPGAGITGTSMQFHGTADVYALAGARAVADLQAGASTPSQGPAVSMRTVSGGGDAVAFTYDLARSVVYTRQGNPQWAGQERDGSAPIRSDDLYFGAAAGDPRPDWVDFSRIAIPQADEQQRLLANAIETVQRDRRPLPRFWYLPRGLKAAVVMTGDDHARGGTKGRFNSYASQSAAGCSVVRWECIRSTSYIYPNTPITDAQGAGYQAQGFEIALHVNTNCSDYTQASLESTVTQQLSQFASAFPSLSAPVTNRTHCIPWSDWASQPKVERAHGIRLDTTYYYWPDTWVNDRPGMFTGSGFPMRFADTDGSVIDVYQATTQMTDESGQTYPKNIDALLDNALGPNGYYGTFVANMHTDTATSTGSDAILASAANHGVPIISAKQLLTWVDGRNASTIGSIAYSAGALTFSVTPGAGTDGLEFMVPMDAAGGRLTSLQRGTSAVTYRTETIKGVDYAIATATAGSYRATYAAPPPPSGPLTISDVTAVAGRTGSTATVTWTTNNASDSRIDYGIGTLTASATSAASTTSHTITLTGLVPGTTYSYRVSSADSTGTRVTSPPTTSPPATFTTPFFDTTAAQFQLGTVGTSYVGADGDGEVLLPAPVATEFDGSALPAGWTSTLRTGGSATVSGGRLALEGATASTSATYAPDRTLEFRATFTAAAYEHVGFGLTLNESPWAIFSTGSGGNLYARTRLGTSMVDTALGASLLNTSHRYRIDWTSSQVTFSVDGAVVATRAVAITTAMRPIGSDFNVDGRPTTLEWLRMSPYATSSTYMSRVVDAGHSVTWSSPTWTAATPAGTSVAVAVRAGDAATPDGTWSAFVDVTSGGTVTSTGRYLQYRITLTSTDGRGTPEVSDVSLPFSG